MDEVIAATAYLELFIRRITEPALMRIFLKFLTTGKHDGIVILESLITRINSGSRVWLSFEFACLCLKLTVNFVFFTCFMSFCLSYGKVVIIEVNFHYLYH